MMLMDTIVVGYDFGFKMGWPRAYCEPVTQQIVADASKYTVKGCCTSMGNYRGR